MPASRYVVRAALLIATLSGLAGCDTLGMNFGSSAPTPPVGRAIDYRNDDIANMVFALDMPASLRPVSGGTVASLDLSTAKGEKHVRATLTLADGDTVDGALPPPAAGRTYVIFGFGDKDKAAMRGAQQWLKAQGADAAPVAVLNVTPKLCETAAIDPAAATLSILPALPGTALLPIASNTPIMQLIGGGQVPPCGST